MAFYDCFMIALLYNPHGSDVTYKIYNVKNWIRKLYNPHGSDVTCFQKIKEIL